MLKSVDAIFKSGNSAYKNPFCSFLNLADPTAYEPLKVVAVPGSDPSQIPATDVTASKVNEFKDDETEITRL